MLSIRIRIAGIAIAAALAVPAAAGAQSSAGGEAGGEQSANPVVAVVNGTEISYQDLLESARQLPAQYRNRVESILPLLLERAVDMELVGQAAQQAGLEDDAQVRERLEDLKTQVIREVYLQRRIDDYVTDARLQEAYQSYVEENPGGEEVKAHHILLESEDEARELIAELEGGADFAELAQAHSTGPTASSGGDLGYFGKGQMVPAFETAAFALQSGEFTAEPVKTQFGWHVIKVTDRRMKEPKSFEEMEQQLRQQLQRQAIESVLADLRADAEVEVYKDRLPTAPAGAGSGGGQSGSDQN